MTVSSFPIYTVIQHWQVQLSEMVHSLSLDLFIDSGEGFERIPIRTAGDNIVPLLLSTL